MLHNIRSKNIYDDFAVSESAGLKFVNNLEEEYWQCEYFEYTFPRVTELT
jgi:hypothetical protein